MQLKIKGSSTVNRTGACSRRMHGLRYEKTQWALGDVRRRGHAYLHGPSSVTITAEKPTLPKLVSGIILDPLEAMTHCKFSLTMFGCVYV